MSKSLTLETLLNTALNQVRDFRNNEEQTMK